MKVILLFLAAGLVGISARHGSGRRVKAKVENLTCQSYYDKCMNTRLALYKTIVFSELECSKNRDYCLKKAKEMVGKKRKPVGPPHGNKRRRFCPKKFCKCFGGLVNCIKSVHNRTMSFETENKHDANFNESFRNVSGPPNVALIGEVFLAKASNGSKGNRTKDCVIKFKECLMERPKSGIEKDWGNMEEDEDSEEEEHNGDGENEEEGGEIKVSGTEQEVNQKNEKSPEYEMTLGDYSRLLRRQWEKMLKDAILGSARELRGHSHGHHSHGHHGHGHHGHGHHGHGHHGHGHHGHGRHGHHGHHGHGHHGHGHDGHGHHGHHHGCRLPRSFRQCMVRGRICKILAHTRKATIECYRKVAKCLFQACKMFKD